MTLDQVAERFQNVRRAGANLSARCPAHDDSKNSLSLSKGDKAIVLKCQAGCETSDVLEKIGLTFADLYPNGNGHAQGKFQIAATYEYRDEVGTLLYEAVRLEPKDFLVRRPDGAGGWTWKLGDTRRVLYRLPELLKADPAATIGICEGEKDVDRLRSHGFTATTNQGGAGKWRKEFNEHLNGRHIIILPHNDPVGHKHAEQVAASLHGTAASVKVVELPGLTEKGADVSDWLNAGGTAEELRALAEKAPEWEPMSRKAEKESAPATSTGFHLTDLGNSHRLVARHGGDLRHLAKSGTWLIYDGTRWAEDVTAEIVRRAKATIAQIYAEAADQDEENRKVLAKHAVRSESAQKIAAMVKLAESEPGIAIRHEDFDRDHYLFNVQNGTLDLKVGELRAAQT